MLVDFQKNVIVIASFDCLFNAVNTVVRDTQNDGAMRIRMIRINDRIDQSATSIGALTYCSRQSHDRFR